MNTSRQFRLGAFIQATGLTTGNEYAAGNFGLEHHSDHSQRYERATEFVEVVKGLWKNLGLRRPENRLAAQRKEARLVVA